MCKKENTLCILPDKNWQCDACTIRRKRCLWGGKGIPKSHARKGEVKDVEVMKGTKRGTKRPIRTASAPGPELSLLWVSSSEPSVPS